MFKKFLSLEIKNFLRSSRLASGILGKIFSFFIYFNLGIIFVGLSVFVYAYSKEENVEPVRMFCTYFLVYLSLDLILKYLLQQLPTENIKPLLTQNISKDSITKYTLGKIMLSFFSWAFLLFMIPFSAMLLFGDNAPWIKIIPFFIGMFSLVIINTFINVLINKNQTFLYSVGIALSILAALHYFHWVDVFSVSEQIFWFMYQNPLLFLIPLSLMVISGFYTYTFIRANLYLDKGLEMKQKVGKSEDIKFLHQFGSLGTFITNDIRLIKRSKAARSAVLGGVFFLFYGLLASSAGYKTSPMQVLIGLFVTGGFNFVFGQRVPAWDSSYYPLMMTLKVPYKDYLKAKWLLMVFGILISMILSTAYLFYNKELYLTIFAAGLYNLGVNSYLTMFAGAFNKKPIDLNSSSKGFSSGQNNFNMKLLLISIPQMLLPMAVFGGIKYFYGMTPAILSLGVLGIIGFLLRNRILDLIAKTYKSEKYTTLDAFKQL